MMVMRKIIVIGTLHAGSTPNKELKAVLERYEPDQLLVEIAQKDIDRGKIVSYPPEMRFVCKWGKRMRIKVSGFDSKINVMKKGVTERDNQRLIKEEGWLMRGLTWKDLNKSSNLKKIDTPLYHRIVDHKKERKREVQMAKNIINSMVSRGAVVIVTGAGHLDFFQKRIPNAIFPFR